MTGRKTSTWDKRRADSFASQLREAERRATEAKATENAVELAMIADSFRRLAEGLVADG